MKEVERGCSLQFPVLWPFVSCDLSTLINHRLAHRLTQLNLFRRPDGLRERPVSSGGSGETGAAERHGLIGDPQHYAHLIASPAAWWWALGPHEARLEPRRQSIFAVASSDPGHRLVDVVDGTV